MPVSNEAFLAVNEIPPLESAGWEIRVLSYKDFSTPVAIISSYQSFMIGPELNDVGAGSVTMDLEDDFWKTELWDGIGAADILNKEYLFQAWEEGVLRFEWLGSRINTDEVNSREQRTVTISGPGTAQVLEWAKVWPPNYPNYSKTVHWLGKTPAMQLYYKLVKAAQDRGTIGYVNMNFTYFSDSSGQAWADLSDPREIKIEYGENLLDMIGTATGQDDSDPWNIRADWYMRPRFQLDVRQDFGAHLEGRVIFYEGDIEDRSRKRERDKIYNYVGVRDDLGNISLSQDSASTTTWQKREWLETRAQYEDALRRDKIAQILLLLKKDEDSQWTVKVPYDRETRRPFRDYGIGDWIGVSKWYTNKPSVVEQYRVLSIVIEMDSDGVPNLELTLESVLDARRRKLERDLTRVLNTPVEGGIKVPTGPDVPSTPPMPVIWDPDNGFRADPNYSLGSGNGGNVFVQPTDPATDSATASQVGFGDFWIQTF